MKLLVILIFIFLFILIVKEFINRKRKEIFKTKIDGFATRFLQPLINKEKVYEIFTPISIEKAKIFIRLLKEELNSDYINIDSDITITETDKLTGKEYVLANAVQEARELSYWSLNDSIKFLNEKLFELLFQKFIKNFAINNPECTDSWNDIKISYIKTFDSNIHYLNFISRYIELKKIELPFCNTIENLEKDIFSTIENIALDEKANEYKKIIDNDDCIVEKKLSIDEIDNMSGIDFENLLANLFVELNYQVTLTKATGDQGADLIISKLNEKKVVQAKRYSYHVSNKAVQEAIGAIKFYNADSAIVVTNNYFTKSAIELAEANNVELWDRDCLINKLKIHMLEI